MAYMTDFSTCPDTHPILLPQLMYQAEFHMDGIPKDAKPTDFVLANSATMASFHADYIAGFDEGVPLVSWSHVYATRARTVCHGGGRRQATWESPCQNVPDEVVDNIKLVLDAPADGDAHDTCLRKCRTVLKKGGHVNA
jgi:hypothetical protein